MRLILTLLVITTAICLPITPGMEHAGSRAVSFSAIRLGNPVIIPRETITGRQNADSGFAWNYGYDIEFDQGKLMVKVAANLVPAGGVSKPALNRLKSLWKERIERVWSGRYALETISGRRYPIAVAVSFSGPVFHHDIIVRPGSRGTDALNWNIQDSPELVAHEFGHLIGLFDEYVGGALGPDAVVADPGSIMTSNPGRGAESRSRHYEAFRQWFVDKTVLNQVRIVDERVIHEQNS